MSTGREDVSGIQEETEEITGVFEGSNEKEELDDYDPKETAAQTADRILKGEVTDDKVRDEGKDFEKEEVKTKGEVKEVRGQKKNDDLDPELSPPERLDAQGRQLFNNLPKGLKRQYHKAIKDLESGNSKDRQALLSERQEIQSIRDAAMPFAGEWAEKGRTVPQAVAELGAFQRKLAHPDISIRENTYLQLAQQAKIDLVKLANKAMGRTDENASSSGNLPDISNHPLVSQLQGELNSLREQMAPLQSSYQQQIDSQVDQEADLIVSQVEAFRNETDPASGNLRYPELFDEVFLGRMKPLVSELMRNGHEMTWGQAYKEAHRLMTNRGNPHQTTNQTRPQASTNNNSIAHKAAISVRGKASPSIGIPEMDIPPEATKSAQATMDWVMRNLNGRG